MVMNSFIILIYILIFNCQAAEGRRSSKRTIKPNLRYIADEVDVLKVRKLKTPKLSLTKTKSGNVTENHVSANSIN